MLRLLNKICNILDKVMVFLASEFLLAMFSIIVANAIMRYVFNSSFLWAYDVLRVLMVGLVFFAACIVYYRNEHIRFVFLYERLPEPIKKSLNILMYVSFCVLFLVLGVKGIQFSVGAWSIKLAASGVSNFWLYIFLSISMIVMVIDSLKLILEEIVPMKEEARK